MSAGACFFLKKQREDHTEDPPKQHHDEAHPPIKCQHVVWLVRPSPHIVRRRARLLFAGEGILPLDHVLHVQGVKRDLAFGALEMEHLLQHPIQRGIREKMVLAWGETPPAAHVSMVSGKPDFLQVHGLARIEQEQGGLEFETPLMDGNCVTNVSCGGTDQVLVRLATEGDLELPYAVHTIKQPEEMNLHPRTTESDVEFLHVFDQRLVLGRGIRIRPRDLVVAESIPRKADHFFVALREQAQFMDHFSQEPRGVGASREPKNVDVIPGGVISHNKAIGRQHMALERCAHTLINGRYDIRLQTSGKAKKS